MIFKVVLCGDSCVGKHTWQKRAVENVFVESWTSWVSPDFGIKEIGNDKLQIWDTRGPENFRDITRTCFPTADCMIIICDLTQRSSFNNIAQWLYEIDRYCASRIPVYLIVNKADLTSRQTVSYEELYDCASHHDIPCFITSAKTGSGVQESIQQIYENLKELVSIYTPMITYSIQQFKADYQEAYTRDRWGRNGRMLQMINDSSPENELNFHTIIAHTGNRTKAVLRAAGFNVGVNSTISADGQSICRSNAVNDHLPSLSQLLLAHAEATRVGSVAPEVTIANTSQVRSSNSIGIQDMPRRMFEATSATTSFRSATGVESLPQVARIISDSSLNVDSHPSTLQNSLSAPVTLFSSTQNNSTKSELAEDENDHKKVPNEYLCAITFEIMEDPVILETGQTYERANILKWLKDKNTCPITGLRLKSKALIPCPSGKLACLTHL